jgi:hypothetical protein
MESWLNRPMVGGRRLDTQRGVATVVAVMTATLHACGHTSAAEKRFSHEYDCEASPRSSARAQATRGRKAALDEPGRDRNAGRSETSGSGEGLKPSKLGARVRYTGSERKVIDGPFAETKELVAGYITIRGSKAEAIALAKRWLAIHVEAAPGVKLPEAQIEIRQVFELEDFPQNGR